MPFCLSATPPNLGAQQEPQGGGYRGGHPEVLGSGRQDVPTLSHTARSSEQVPADQSPPAMVWRENSQASITVSRKMACTAHKKSEERAASHLSLTLPSLSRHLLASLWLQYPLLRWHGRSPTIASGTHGFWQTLIIHTLVNREESGLLPRERTAWLSQPCRSFTEPHCSEA